MATQFVIGQNALGGNKFLLASNSNSAIPIAFNAQQAQQSTIAVNSSSAIAINALQAQQSASALTVWAFVTLAAPINFGPGSVANLAFFSGSAPTPGDVIAYDPASLIIATDGSISASAYGTWQAQYNDGSGFVPFLITFAAWNVGAQQAQQSAMAGPGAAVAVGFTAQQPQQTNMTVGLVGGIATNAQQAQQAVIAVAVKANAGFTSQQRQQGSTDVVTAALVGVTAKQAQQDGMQIATAPMIAFNAQQGQQSTSDVIVPFRPVITMGPQQSQQASALVSTSANVGMVAEQAQQASADVLVPFRPVIATTVEQAQQATMAVSAVTVVNMNAEQPQQITAQVLAFPSIAFTAKQAQQSAVSLPNLPAPVVAFAAQQAQQINTNVLVFPSINMLAQQAQTGTFDVLPLPAQLGDLDPEDISFSLFATLSQQPDTKLVYIGRDNAALLGVNYNDLPLDLGGVTRIELEILGPNIVLDSDQSPGFITWVPGSNIIKFKLGMAVVPKGIYPVSLVLFDVAHPDGQTIAGPGCPFLKFDFENDIAA